jgi:hypothetical protein
MCPCSKAQVSSVARAPSYNTRGGQACTRASLLVQMVEHPSRIHLDIESDDIEAEVQRIERLGARRIEQIRTLWVLEAPTGQRFCVVRPQRGRLGPTANEWT